MTTPTDEALRAAYRSLLQSRAEGGRSAPPVPLEALVALVERRGSEAERLGTLDRVMQDAQLMHEYHYLRAVREAADRPAAALPLMNWRPLALAAGVTLAVTAAILVGVRGRTAAEPLRGQAVAVALVAPAASDLLRDGSRLVWRGVAGAERYEVEVLTADGETALYAATVDTALVVGAPHVLLPATRYRWRVRAVLAEGGERVSEFRAATGP